MTVATPSRPHCQIKVATSLSRCGGYICCLVALHQSYVERKTYFTNDRQPHQIHHKLGSPPALFNHPSYSIQ